MVIWKLCGVTPPPDHERHHEEQRQISMTDGRMNKPGR